MKVLVAYASVHGSTAEVAAFIGRTLDVYDLDVTVAHADTVPSITDYDVIIMGSAVHASMWLPSLSQFMFRFEKELVDKTKYLWLNCIIALEEGGEEKAYQLYLWDEALQRLNLTRDNVRIFAGKLDWNQINRDERWLIATNYEGKELPGNQQGDYRDWVMIGNWVHQVAREFSAGLAFPEVQAPNSTLRVKNETVTEEDVNSLAWPDNPGEGAGL